MSEEQQRTIAKGNTVIVERLGRGQSVVWSETHTFDSEREAEGRARIINEALSWVGTPFVNCADVKGPNGGVDCAMLQARTYMNSGRLAPFDPRPYSSQWMLHRSEEQFLAWIETKLGGVRTETPKIADCIVWQFGRCFSHGGILINSRETVHAFAPAGLCLISPLDYDSLDKVSLRGTTFKRPRLFFTVGGEW